MRSGTGSQLVAVGIDGTEATIKAARYAAEVAGQRGWDLMVVHSYEAEGSGSVLMAGESSTSVQAAELLVDEVLSVLGVGSNTRVHRMITPSSPADALCQVSRYVSLLVLGQRRVNPADPLLAGRVGAAVAAGARCPVVAVPAGWSPESSSGRPVVVALDGEDPSEVALRLACEEAGSLGTGVLAMLGVQGHGDGPFTAEEPASLGVLLAKVRLDHPSVEVRTVIFNGAVRTGTFEAPVAAAQVVVSRPPPDRAGESWSRLLASAVVAESFCPVLITPAEHPADEAGAARAYLGRGAPAQTPAVLPATEGERPEPEPRSRWTGGRLLSAWRRRRTSPADR